MICIKHYLLHLRGEPTQKKFTRSEQHESPKIESTNKSKISQSEMPGDQQSQAIILKWWADIETECVEKNSYKLKWRRKEKYILIESRVTS